jgi:hypothetical protein
MRARLLVLLATTVAAVALAGCGGGDATTAGPAPGTPEKPLQGRLAESPNEAPDGEGAKETPSYQALVDDQARDPQRRFTPCDLVSKGRARTILGRAIADPVEAPQGPTCIYRGRRGGDFITVAVQPLRLDRARRRLTGAERLDIGGREAYCGRLGQPILYLRLAKDRVLSIAGGPCSIARQFAQTAAREFSA